MIKKFILILSATIGINLWFVPQISEHCPKNTPGRLIIKIDWLIRPGRASILTPKQGIVHEWITSLDEINIRIWVFIGIEIRLSTSKRRKLSGKSELEIIYESNLIFLKSEYS